MAERLPETALSVPGKTFLVGEYLALSGGPSLLVATEPRFVLRAKPIAPGARVQHPFANASPAGRYFSRKIREPVIFEFHDPHHGAGGLGASSAQYALLYAWQNKIAAAPTSDTLWSELLREYRLSAWSGEGAPPSGADVVAQLMGGVCYFDGQKLQARRLQWRFPELSFTLLRTGAKLATHEHLKQASDLMNARTQALLRTIVSHTEQALLRADADLFTQCIRDYAASLMEAGLTSAATLELLSDLRSQPWLLAAKGCGAMGADVILAVHRKAHEGDVKAWAFVKGLKICGDLASLGQGLKVEQERVEQ